MFNPVLHWLQNKTEQKRLINNQDKKVESFMNYPMVEASYVWCM